MRLNELLIRNRKEITDSWFNRVVDTYPPETAAIFKSQKDQFANPVGSAARYGIPGLFDQLIGEMDPRKITSFLDPLIRIRAVQTLFSASQAVGFIFLLKETVRAFLEKEVISRQLVEELFAFEKRIDQVVLIGFNIFTECREKIAELKAFEMKDRTFRAFERAGLVAEEPENPLSL